MTVPTGDVVERLLAEFDGRLSLSVISDVVRAADRDLAEAPAGARDELVERCARQRLLDTLRL